MKSSEIFKGDWIAPAPLCSAPLIRDTIELKDFESAKIKICGLGFFELYINEKKVGSDLLVPANSNYEERRLDTFSYPIHDKLSHRIYVMEYDISSYLSTGKNAIGVMLGTGWYAQNRRSAEGNGAFGRIKLAYTIEVEAEGETKTFSSGSQLRWEQSEIIFNNLYLGERHDYALEKKGWCGQDYDFSGWKAVEIVEAPESSFEIQSCPADKIIRKIQPKKIYDFGETCIYDMGENITGWVAVSCEKAERKITAFYSEEIFPNGTLDFSSCGGENQIQQEIFENVEPGREYCPHFTWHGFRYLELSSNARPLYCAVVHSDVAQTSAFDCDNETLNWLYEAFIRTQLCNMHCGVPSDCPHIERLGYTGDGQLCCEAAMLTLGSEDFYRKWLSDIEDCQDKNNGHVQHTAPFAGGGGGPSGWGGAIVVVPYVFYKQYGDKDLLRRFFPKMLKYFEYMCSRSENGLVVREEEDGWCLGDWCAPGGIAIPEPFVNTCLFVKFMLTAIEIAGILNEKEKVSHLPAIIGRARQALEQTYYSSQFHHFMGGLQGADALGLDIGLGDEKTFKEMCEKYEKLGMFDTGIIATPVLTKILFERNENDLAFSLLAGEGEYSFNKMMKAGATTLWEYWEGHRSHSHPMFGAVTQFLFTHLLGIGQEKGGAGYKRVVVSPRFVKGMNRCSGHITTPEGVVSVSYEKKNGSANVTINTAPGMNAVFSHNGEETELVPGENRLIINLK